MSRLVLAGGGELDVSAPAGRVLSCCDRVAVVTLAAAFRRPDALRADIRAWADALTVDHVVVEAVRRADSIVPATSAPIADSDGVLVLDGSSAHLVGALKATPLLDAIVGAQADGATVVWSGAAASAVCDPMVDARGGALTVGLGVYKDVAVATGWESWSRERRRRLCRMLARSVLFMGMESGAVVQSASVRPWDSVQLSDEPDTRSPSAVDEKASPGGRWTVIGGAVEALQAGGPVALGPDSADSL